ncbi:uncharacterized protein LOC143291964 [Babylonia areolata]|uniref:uncharacterized protein LOC143291964 n=1 Tax=Babylonia areolata TaxID=304850 RepID=UPI003FD12A7D
MKGGRIHLLLLVILLITVSTISYFIFIPRTFLHSHPHFTHREHAPFFDKISSSSPSQWSIDTTIVTSNLKETREVILANTDASLDMVRKIYAQNGLVLFTMINDAFLDFAASWCCNTASFDHIHQQTLFLTTDLQTGQRLQALWPNVSVVAMTSPEFQGSQEYSKVGYVRLMTERTRFILRLLETGVQLLLFEVDCVWLTSPLPVVLAHRSNADIVATKVTGKNTIAGGFLLLNPTRATVKFWQQLTHMMNQLFVKLRTHQKTAGVSEGLNDQEFFSSLARQKYGGIRIVFLPSTAFPDGKWYSLSEKQRKESKPIIINNNWVLGNNAKRQRAKTFGHWFWDDSQGKCNSSAIHHLSF